MGNCFQCKDDKTGDWATNPAGEVEMTIETDSKFWVYPQVSYLMQTKTYCKLMGKKKNHPQISKCKNTEQIQR